MFSSFRSPFILDFSVKSPGGFHQLNKVFIVVDGCRHGRIIVVPLGSLNSSIMVSVGKVGEELHEDLVFSQSATDDLRVETAIVYTLEI